MHTSDKPLKYSEIIKKLKTFGVQEIKRKSVRRMLYHPNINGKPSSYPMHVHNENQEFSRAVVRAVRDHFNIALEDFYNA